MNIFEFNVKTKDNPEGYSTLQSNSVEISLMNIQNSKANILKGNYFTTLWNRHNFELTKIEHDLKIQFVAKIEVIKKLLFFFFNENYFLIDSDYS